MSEQYQTEAESPDDRAAARQLIATYQPNSTDGVVDQLCLHTDAWSVWNSIFTTVCEVGADVPLLATLSEAILKTAAAAGPRERETWYRHHVRELLMQSRESWDGQSSIVLGNPPVIVLICGLDTFGNDDPSRRVKRQHLMAFLAGLTAAGISPCFNYFIGNYKYILQPQGNAEDFVVDSEDLIIIEEYFRIAGPWMKSQFDVVSDVQEGWDNSRTETGWGQWKRNLRILAEQSTRQDVPRSLS